MSQTTIQDTQFEHIYTVTVSDLNQYGILHGGRLLTLCDEFAYVSAQHHANGSCLTRAVHQARFHRATEQGEELIFRARVGLTGRSSLWVPIEVSDEHGVCIMDAVIVFAAIDENRQPRRVPPVCASSDEDKQLQKRLLAMKNSQSPA